MNNHKIELVPITSGNKNITLNECTYYKNGISSAKCSGILDINDAYYVYIECINSKKNFMFIQKQPQLVKFIICFQSNFFLLHQKLHLN